MHKDSTPAWHLFCGVLGVDWCAKLRSCEDVRAWLKSYGYPEAMKVAGPKQHLVASDITVRWKFVFAASFCALLVGGGPRSLSQQR